MRRTSRPGPFRALATAVLLCLLGSQVPHADAAVSPSPTPTPVQVPRPSAASGADGSRTLPQAPQFSLTVSPTRLVLRSKDLAGSHVFRVINRGRSALDVTVSKSDFFSNTDGSLRFAANAPYAASRWATVSPMHFTLPAMTEQAVTLSVAVPRKADLGDHHVSLAFLVPAGKASGNIKINRGVATPVLITVPGPTTDDTKTQWLHAPRFALRGPVTLDAALRDTGTVHRDFRGRGRLVVQAAGTGGTFPDFTVMRGATRDISTTWDPPLACVCSVSLAIPQKDGSISSQTSTVIVLPVDLMAGGVALIAGLVLLARYRRRRFNSRVLAAAAALVPAGSGGV